MFEATLHYIETFISIKQNFLTLKHKNSFLCVFVPETGQTIYLPSKAFHNIFMLIVKIKLKKILLNFKSELSIRTIWKQFWTNAWKNATNKNLALDNVKETFSFHWIVSENSKSEKIWYKKQWRLIIKCLLRVPVSCWMPWGL